MGLGRKLWFTGQETFFFYFSYKVPPFQPANRCLTWPHHESQPPLATCKQRREMMISTSSELDIVNIGTSLRVEETAERAFRSWVKVVEWDKLIHELDLRPPWSEVASRRTQTTRGCEPDRSPQKMVSVCTVSPLESWLCMLHSQADFTEIVCIPTSKIA